MQLDFALKVTRLDTYKYDFSPIFWRSWIPLDSPFNDSFSLWILQTRHPFMSPPLELVWTPHMTALPSSEDTGMIDAPTFTTSLDVTGLFDGLHADENVWSPHMTALPSSGDTGMIDAPTFITSYDVTRPFDGIHTNQGVWSPQMASLIASGDTVIIDSPPSTANPFDITGDDEGTQDDLWWNEFAQFPNYAPDHLDMDRDNDLVKAKLIPRSGKTFLTQH